MPLRKSLSALVVLACISVAFVAVGQQPPASVSSEPSRVMPAASGSVGLAAHRLPSSQRHSLHIELSDFGAIPGHRRVSQPYGLYIDPEGSGELPGRWRVSQNHSICIDPFGFGAIPGHLRVSQPYGLYIDPWSLGLTIGETKR